MESRNYDIAKAKAYRAEQANVGLINSRKLFEQSLFAATADVFKPITQSVRDAGVTSNSKNETNSAKLLQQLEKLPEKEQVTKAIELLNTKNKSTVSEDTIKAFLSSTENRDTIFGLVKSREHQADTFKFGVMDLLEHFSLLQAPHVIEFSQNVDGEWLVTANRVFSHTSSGAVGGPVELTLTESLLAMLTKDTVSTDHNANSQYMRLLKLSVGPELTTLVYERGRGRRSTSERQVLDEFKKIRKFNELIMLSKFVATGQGYRDMANEKIIIPSDASSQMHRVFVLLGSKLAGSSADDLKEYSALLEQLLREKKISKQLFKVLYYKYKQST
jgi:hypothetical protein